MKTMYWTFIVLNSALLGLHAYLIINNPYWVFKLLSSIFVGIHIYQLVNLQNKKEIFYNDTTNS